MKPSQIAERQIILFARIRDELRQWEKHGDAKAKRRASRLLALALEKTATLTALVTP